MYVNVNVYVYVVEYVRECAHMFMTFHNGFMFVDKHLLHQKYIHIFVHVIMNRHGSHNIRNGIAGAKTGHGTFT